MLFSPKTKVVVLRGGPADHYDISLKSGGYILSHLGSLDDKYEPLDVFISKDGTWHLHGVPREPHDILLHTDVVWNSLYGPYGEGGQIQRLLERLQVPFVGSGSMASAMSLNREMSKRRYVESGLAVPRYKILVEEDATDESLIDIFRTYMHPLVVGAITNVGSHDKYVVRGFRELVEAVNHTLSHSPKVVIEECIQGETTLCGVVEGVRGQDLYTLVPTGAIDAGSKKLVEQYSKMAHSALGLRHYSVSEFVLSPKGRIYILGTRSQPDFHTESHMHSSLDDLGWRIPDFIDHVIGLTNKARN